MSYANTVFSPAIDALAKAADTLPPCGRLPDTVTEVPSEAVALHVA